MLIWLVEGIREAGEYSPELITLEVGSRGPFHQAGFDDLKAYLDAPTKEWEAKQNLDTAKLERPRITVICCL